MLREYLDPSGLFIEGTEHYSSSAPIHTYYGFNVTKSDREPIDQIHGFLAAKRIQERNHGLVNEAGTFYAFVAGIFEVLNATSPEDIQRVIEVNSVKESNKKELFTKIATAFDINCEVHLTSDLWNDERYWNALTKVLQYPQFSKGNLRRDTMQWYQTEEMLNRVLPIAEVASDLMDIPKKLMKKIGRWPAATLYTPIEVAEAKYYAAVHDVSCKIGHMDETVYDKYILEFMDVIHLRQPVDFKSTRIKPRGVTPYIHKPRPRDPKVRLFFDDTPATIQERLSEYPPENFVFAIIPDGGEVLNPYIDKVVLAIESARAMGLTPVTVENVDLNNGIDIITALYDQSISILTLEKVFPELIYSYLIEPFA